MQERNRQALRRQNLWSSGAGAVAGAIVVGLLAAIDPAIPLAGVGVRTASAFVFGSIVDAVAKAAFEYGADEVLVADEAAQADLRVEP